MHHKRIVPGYDMRGRVGEAVKKFEAFEHLRDVVHDRKGAALFKIIVEVRGVRSENDPAAARPDSGALQSGGMAADAVHGEAGSEFVIAIVEDRFFRIDVTNHFEHVFQVKRRAKLSMAHRASRGEGHFAILQMKVRRREAIEITGVIVMKMGDDYVRDAIRIDADQSQGIDGMAKRLAASANGSFVGESGVEYERGISAARHPNEVVEIGGRFMRIGGDEIVVRTPVAKMSVANRENFEWFDRHASLSASVIPMGGLG